MNKATESKDTNIELPSLLSFERKLETSDALMYSGNWGGNPIKESNWKKIPIIKRQNRSTISNHGTKDDDKAKPNPVSSDSDDANLTHDKDTLKVSFTLRVVGGIGSPFACNEPKFESAISEKINEFKDRSLQTLAKRYAYNIANGRFLWRNRVCAEEIIINVNSKKSSESLSFDASAFSLNNFNKSDDNKALETLATIIKNGLSTTDEFTLLEIDAYVKLGNGQHVFPSQEMNMNEKGKVLLM